MDEAIRERKTLFSSLPGPQQLILQAVLFLDLAGLSPISAHRVKQVIQDVFKGDTEGLSKGISDLTLNGWFIDNCLTGGILDPEMAFFNTAVIKYARTDNTEQDLIELAKSLTESNDSLGLRLLHLQLLQRQDSENSISLAKAVSNQRVLLPILSGTDQIQEVDREQVLLTVTRSLSLSQKFWFDTFPSSSEYWFELVLAEPSVLKHLDHEVSLVLKIIDALIDANQTDISKALASPLKSVLHQNSTS